MVTIIKESALDRLMNPRLDKASLFQQHWGDPTNEAHARLDNENRKVIRQAYIKLVEAGMVVLAPTKVGYNIMATAAGGLKKMLELTGKKSEELSVLLHNNKHLQDLAWTTEKIRQLYAEAYTENISLGAILPWRAQSYRMFLPEGCHEMIGGDAAISCFLIRYGLPSESIVSSAWISSNALCFGLSANSVGMEKTGKLECVADSIIKNIDMVVEGDIFVTAQQPNATRYTHKNTVMIVSFVTEDGMFSDDPVIIQDGLGSELVKGLLVKIFGKYSESFLS